MILEQSTIFRIELRRIIETVDWDLKLHGYVIFKNRTGS